MSEKHPPAPAIPYPEEVAHLKAVREKIAAALRDAEASVERHQRDYKDFMAYMAQHHGEIDPNEMMRNEQMLAEDGYTGILALKSRDDLARLWASPYFGRIDFDCADAQYAGVFYVGRTTFREGNELYILDWRAPVASMFYDFDLGPAWFDAPLAHVEGTLRRKRQFKISAGVMEYALESSTAIRDDVLQKELSHTSDDKMRSIISTIQKEQNLIIRDEKAKILIIQGVAGSGKTSIALHRIAYLLYRFKDTLSAANVVILSPNMVFADHISGVLPELGEQPVFQMGFAQLARAQLEGIQGFMPEADPLENDDKALEARTRYKATANFLRKMDAYIAHVCDTVFVPQDYAFGELLADKGWIWQRYQAYAHLPVMRRVREVADDILERFIARNIREEPLPKMRDIMNGLNAMLRLRTTRALYREMYRWLEAPRMFAMRGASLEWADVYPFLYLHAAFEGLRENNRIRHLVVDEMQDYTPVQFAVLKKLYHCKMTILGDFSQSVDPAKSHTLEELCAVYPGATLMRLEKSYRSTCEIIAFAGKIRPGTRLQAVQRHGETPRVLPCQSQDEHLALLRRLIAEFRAGEGNTLGILCKRQNAAQALHQALGDDTAMLVTPQSERFSGGVSVLSVGMSKGLEFDEVIVADADADTYLGEHDRNLLYVACTRAMHRLTLLYTGAKSPLIP